jgi:hypothetical protein
MGLANYFSNHTTLTPPEWSRPNSAADRERQKTAQQRAEDIIYTLNHTFTCLTLTDLFIVPVLRGFGLNVGHDEKAKLFTDLKPNQGAESDAYKRLKHDFVSHKTLPNATRWQRVKGEVKHAFSHLNWKNVQGAKNWFIGEAVGDVGAAVVTIPIQRFFPGLMDGIRSVAEPLVGGVFRHSAERDAKKWGQRHQLAPDSAEVVNRAQELYQYEMRHLPQMLTWTVSSVLLHYGVMRKLEPAITIGEFSRQKAAGAAITAGLIFGVRAMAPNAAHKWDSKMGKHVVVPLTKTVGGLFGVKEHEVEAHQKRHGDEAPKNWQARVSEPSSEQVLRGA